MKTEKGASVELMSRLTADDDYAYAVANIILLLMLMLIADAFSSTKS